MNLVEVKIDEEHRITLNTDNISAVEFEESSVLIYQLSSDELIELEFDSVADAGNAYRKLVEELAA